MSDDRLRHRLSERIKHMPSSVLGKDPDTEVYRVHPRVISVVDRASGAQLALKQSKLSEPLLRRQLELVDAVSKSLTFIPKSFGHCIGGDGNLYEIWDWIDDSKGPPISSTGLAGILHSFVLAALEVHVDSSPRFPNETLPSFLSLLNSGQLQSSLDDQRVPANVRRVILQAIHDSRNDCFLALYSVLPRGIVHSDIRADNVLGGHLIDFSNSKIDLRVIEISRFLILNVTNALQLYKISRNPLILGRQLSFLTSDEIALFPRIVGIDFSCIYHWATKTVNSVDHRRNLAAAFLAQCADQVGLLGRPL